MIHFFLVFFFWIMGAVSAHNFYISTTSIKFIPVEKSFQITAQVFLDDFEAAIYHQVNKKVKLTSVVPQKEIDSLVKDYFKKNIIFKSKEKIIDFDFLGKVYKNDLLLAYMELRNIPTDSELSIKNTLLFNLLPDQKNIIHLKVGSKRKSFLAVSSKSEFELPQDFFVIQN